MRIKALFFLAAFVLFAACNKDDTEEIKPSMSATIDNDQWVSLTRITVEKNENFIITGTSLAGETIVITVFANAVGTYNLNTTSIGFSAAYKETISASASDTYFATSGTVEITEINTTAKTISGTFNFTLLKGLNSTLTLTAGEFTKLEYSASVE